MQIVQILIKKVPTVLNSKVLVDLKNIESPVSFKKMYWNFLFIEDVYGELITW